MNIRVVLVEPHEEGNVGSVARIMKNFGFADLALVNPCRLGASARCLASHGIDILESAKVFPTLQDAVAGCDYVIGTTGKKGGKNMPLREPMTPEQLARNVAKAPGKAAILFGNERAGLTNEQMKLCDAVARIPANPDYPILNLAQAVCAILYEFSKIRFTRRVKEKPPSRAELDVMYKYLHELIWTVYDQEHKRRAVEGVMKRILGKSFLIKKEANTVTSLCRKSLDRIK